MDESFLNQLRRTWHHAQRDGQATTHWLMTPSAVERLRYENRDFTEYETKDVAQSTFMGLPVYLTTELDPPGFMLREGEPPDELREQELRRQLRVIQRRYQELAWPIVDELAKLEARKPPEPRLFRGGSADAVRA